MDGVLKTLKKWIGVKEENIKTIIGEDFNMRTGRKGIGRVEDGEEEEEEKEETRKSKDRKINRESKRLIEFLEKRSWILFKGGIK